MAKRRKETDSEADKPFKLPKFNEEEFLKRERRNIKTTFLSFGFGLLMSFICFGFWTLMGHQDVLRWPLVLLVAVVNAVFLKPIFLRSKIDLKDFTGKNWFSSYMIYFFTWLIFFIVIINPPFYDDEPPMIQTVVLPDMQEPGGNVLILAKITDNSGVEKQQIKLEITLPNGSVIHPDFTYEYNILRYTYQGPDNITDDQTYTYKITVADTSGHKKEKTGSFTYSYNTIKLPEPEKANQPPGADVTYTTNIIFDVSTNVSRVYYTINGGKEINATYNEDTGYYYTTPKKEGWIKGANVTMQVYAQIIYYFENTYQQFNNTIVDANQYYFQVSNSDEIGTEKSDEITLPSPRFVRVPGFEMVVFIASLIAVVLILKKYHKKDRKQ